MTEYKFSKGAEDARDYDMMATAGIDVSADRLHLNAIEIKVHQGAYSADEALKKSVELRDYVLAALAAYKPEVDTTDNILKDWPKIKKISCDGVGDNDGFFEMEVPSRDR